MNWIDKIISQFNPIAAAKREAARFAIEEMRNYQAAGKGRRTTHWRSTNNSADAEIIPSLSTLRNTSRDMVRNNSYAYKAIEGLTTNTIGTGIRANLTSPKNNDQQLKIIKQYWKNWAEKTECDFLSDVDFYGIQSLAARAMFESGECLIIRRRIPSSQNSVLPIKLQILEPDFIDTHKNLNNMGNANYINQGIEYNKNGQRVAYWLFKEHPGNLFGYNHISERYDADDVIHLFRKTRPGQERGVPAGVSSFLRLNDFDDYEDAELMRQKVAACFAVFISGGIDGLPTKTDEDFTPREKLAPGIIERLKPGQTVSFASPPGTNGYGDYSRKVLQGSAAGYGVTYEVLTGDLSNVNFSSGRMGWLEFQRLIVDLQINVFIPKICERVFKWFSEAVFLKTGIPVDSAVVDWTPPRREMVDPAKETKAIIDQILNGLTSWSEAVRELGYNADDLLEQISKDQLKFKEKGVKLNSDPNTATPLNNNNENQGGGQ